jgi:hypothetical protein
MPKECNELFFIERFIKELLWLFFYDDDDEKRQKELEEKN